MITTGCEGCCFAQQSDKGRGCALGQMCVTKDGEMFAPGYCRICRSHKWREKQGTVNLAELYSQVIDECALKFDLLVFFDERINTIEDLERTLNSDWCIRYCRKVIIADITGFGKERKNLALQYLKNHEPPILTTVNSSVIYEPIDQREETIRRISSQVKSPFFVAIPAGVVIDEEDFDSFAEHVQYMPSRVIHWAFPIRIGETIIVHNKLHYGLFITKPYKTLTKSPEVQSFTEQVRKEEIETDMKLSWLYQDCLITKGKK